MANITIKNFLASLKRRTKRPEKAYPYTCNGGPFNRSTIYLTTGHTFNFRVGPYHGHYSEGNWVPYDE